MLTKLVLCVPLAFGPGELQQRLDETRFAGTLTVNDSTLSGPGFTFSMDWKAADSRIPSSFIVAADPVHPSFTKEELTAIEAHTHVLYLSSAGMRDAESALATTQQAHTVVVALLEAGALGVKSESSGIAHGRRRWVELWDATREGFTAGRSGVDQGYDSAFASLILAWVRMPLEGEKYTHTTGMHLLGQAEIGVANGSLPTGQDFADALLRFATYQCRNGDSLRPGLQLALGPEAKKFELNFSESSFYESEDLFYNPTGTWTLSPQ